MDLVSKREPVLVLCFVVIGPPSQILTRTYHFFTEYLEFQGIHTGFANNLHLVHFATVTSQLFILLLGAIIWKSFYNWRKSSDLLRFEWQQQLQLLDKLDNNNLKCAKRQPWTLKYGNMFSNAKYLLCVVLALWLLRYLIGEVLIQTVGGLGNPIYDFFTSAWVMLMSIPFIVLGCISSRYFDTIGIRRQLNLVLLGLIVGIVLITTVYAAVPFGIWRILLTYCIHLNLNVLISICMVRVSGLDEYSVEHELSEIHGAQSAHSGQPTEEDDRYALFQAIWKNKEALEQFANHCVTEYSVETVLFLLEYAKFRLLIKERYTDFIEDEEEQKTFVQNVQQIQEEQDFGVQIKPELLRTHPLQRRLNVSDVVNLVEYLYTQFIDDQSVTQVNISGRIRNKLDDVFAKYDLLQLTEEEYSVSSMLCEMMSEFEAASTELAFLLYRDSFPRFCKTKEYREFVHSQSSVKGRAMSPSTASAI